MLSRTLSFLREALTSEREPRQIALAIAIGVLFGILPKANLFAVVALTMLFALRTNLAAGLTTAAVSSFIGPGMDPLFHRIGEAILTWGPMRGFFTTLSSLPYLPWTSFNNTVVMGALVVGLLQFFPTYYWCKRVFGKAPERPAKPSVEPVEHPIPVPKFKQSRKSRRYLISADSPQ